MATRDDAELTSLPLQLASLHGGLPLPITFGHDIGRNEVYNSLATVLHVNDCAFLSRVHLRFVHGANNSVLVEPLGQTSIALRHGGDQRPLQKNKPAIVQLGDIVCLRPTGGGGAAGSSSLFDYTLEIIGSTNSVARDDDDEGRTSSTASRKRPRETTKETAFTHDFRVGDAYLNLLPGEMPSPRHVSWADLLPPDCEMGLFTSLFPEGTYRWLRSVSPHLCRALVVADRCPAPKDKPPPTLTEPDDGWLLLQGQRSGIMHASLMLFRTPRFLRIVCGGTNLEGQIEKDRDALFVQDLPISDHPKTPADDHDAFGAPLLDFLHYMATMYNAPSMAPERGLPAADQRKVREFGEDMLEDVDFAAASGGLVTCTPGGSGGGGHKGGHRMLQQALRTIGAPRLADGRLDIATGHFGAIRLPFLAAMARTLRRREQPSPAGGEWADIGRVFLYHSSRATVLAPGTNAFAVMRTTAPGNRDDVRTDPTLLDKHFHDAIPKFARLPREGSGPGSGASAAADASAEETTLTPILHGKALLATAADGTAGVLVVGSQNFSAASWGEGGRQPTNVELGVVLAAHTHARVQELRARFPITLALEAAFATPAAERGYVMARGPTDSDNTETGLQFRWRARCNDLGSLPAWRLFLHRHWKMCSRCRAADVPCELSVPQMEELAWAGTPFLCAACRGQVQVDPEV